MTLQNLTFVLGGAASGKSAFAEKLCIESGKNRIYLATCQPYDAEIKTKISKHIAQRGDGWTTIEEPMNIAPIFSKFSQGDVVLLDCATLWISNLLLAEADLSQNSKELLTSLSTCKASVVVVSNEVGGGIVPENALARKFRDAQGMLNQQIAAQSDLAVQVVAGLPVVLKGQLPT